MRPSDHALLEELQSQTRDAVRRLLGHAEHEPVALLDIPTYMNVGDSMIYFGELTLLRRLGVRVAYQADRWRYDGARLRDAIGHGPILLNGGGNFGDDWPDFQQFREAVVEHHRDAKIIQLSQSVSFRDPEAAARANAIFARHPDFVLLVRDSQSLQRAHDQLPDVRVTQVPDMAFSMELPTDAGGAGRRRPIILARRDHESTGWLAPAASELVPSAQRVDWGLAGADKLRWRSRKLPARVYSSLPATARPALLERWIQAHYEPLLGENIRAGLRIVGAADPLITDRLHAHVLAVLLDRPSVVADNSNGKISAMMRDYTGRFSSAWFVRNRRELRDVLEAIHLG